ncbi:hypothetical protein QJS66_15045 [Kocuria rhizophila]|nr:hypothetical protein QJS66_15045 [Kocuria rhizophila]
MMHAVAAPAPRHLARTPLRRRPAPAGDDAPAPRSTSPGWTSAQRAAHPPDPWGSCPTWWRPVPPAMIDILTAFRALVGEEAGWPLRGGRAPGARGLASIASRLLLPLLSGRFSRRALLIASLLASGAAPSVAVTGQASGLPALFLAVWFLPGPAPALMMTLISTAVPGTWRGSALAVRLMGNRRQVVTCGRRCGGRPVRSGRRHLAHVRAARRQRRGESGAAPAGGVGRRRRPAIVRARETRGPERRAGWRVRSVGDQGGSPRLCPRRVGDRGRAPQRDARHSGT